MMGGMGQATPRRLSWAKVTQLENVGREKWNGENEDQKPSGTAKKRTATVTFKLHSVDRVGSCRVNGPAVMSHCSAEGGRTQNQKNQP